MVIERIHNIKFRNISKLSGANLFCSAFLAHLFRRKGQAIVISRSLSSSSSSCKNFNVALYSKSFKCINTKLGILVHHDKVQLQNKGHNSKSYSFGVMPLFT